jgi:anaerobic selenocysteine-containing dehydrogenase
MLHQEITRRNFVKTTAAMGAAVGLGIGISDSLAKVDKARAAEASTEKIYKTSCRACIAACAVLAHVRDGRVIKIEGNPESPMSKGGVCAKGLAGIQALYNPMRNKYPMKRVGERGANTWERLSWDNALTEICTEINRVSNKYGSEAISVSTGGGGNPHFSNVKRFGEAINTPNVWEPGCSQCYLPRMGAALLAYGAGKPNNLSFADSNGWDFYFDDCKVTTLVLWATDPSNSSVATGGRCLAELRTRPQGLRTVVIDPRYTLDAAKADVWLPIRPGTDVALLLTWTRWIIENKRYDETFCKTWTNMPYLINPKTRLTLKTTEAGLEGSAKDYVVWDSNTNKPVVVEFPMNENVNPALFGTFTVNGMECKTGGQCLKESCEDWTLEKGASVCWLDADQIKKALEIYTDPSSVSAIMQGVAIDQYPQSQQSALGALNLEFLMGNVERPGAMLQKFATAPCKDQLGNTPRLLTEEMVRKRCGYLEHKGLICWDMAHIPSVLRAMQYGDPYQIHMWIERSGNKHVVLGNSSCLDEIVPKIDTIVHIFMYPTAFSVLCADYLLPCTEWLETNLPVPQLNTIVMRQAVTHLFETVEEGIIWTQIVKRCAELGNTHCPKAFDKNECMTTPFYNNEYEKQKLHLGTLPMTWKEACETGVITWATPEQYRTYYTYKANDGTGKPKGFGTPSKKLEVYCESNIILGRTGYPWAQCKEHAIGTWSLEPASKDYEPLAYYEEPAESPLTDTEYPLVLTEGRLPMYHHGTLRNIPYLREIYPVPEMWIHPYDAKKYGITDGEWVNIESRRGKTHGKARVTTAIAKGVVYQERFWAPELLDSKHPDQSYKVMNINVLTKNDPPYNPEYGTYTLRGFQVKVSPSNDAILQEVWIKPEQFQPWMPEPSDPTNDVFDYGA